MHANQPPAHTPVLIVGAGPVGLTLSLILARFGVNCAVLERNLNTTQHPKMDITNGRSMEIFRQLGISENIISAGVNPDICLDVSWITGCTGYEIHRFKYRNPNEAREYSRQLNDGSQTLEPGIRISQIIVEPLLRDIAAASPNITLCYGWSLEKLGQDFAGVSATITDTQSGKEMEVSCGYLAGCDGGNSKVRSALHIGLDGQTKIRRRYSVHFRSKDKNVLEPWGPAWHYQSPVHGTLISQDGIERYTLHSALWEGEDELTVDPYHVIRRFVGKDIDFYLLLASGWDNNLVVAQKYGEQRVYLAGDSAHQYIPTGGYGMNTGIGDAYALGWALAATVQGWGGSGLLAAYESERRPIGLRNREGSAQHARARLEIGKIWEKNLDNIDAINSRTRLGNQIATLGNAENESFGLEMGYGYPNSPIIWGEDEAYPDDPLHYHPTTLPGYRAPSLYLQNGTAIYDLLGKGFTLLNFAPDRINAGIFDITAEKLGLPLELISIVDDHARDLYQRDLILLRPDQHVCWRGNKIPENVHSLFARVSGRVTHKD